MLQGSQTSIVIQVILIHSFLVSSDVRSIAVETKRRDQQQQMNRLLRIHSFLVSPDVRRLPEKLSVRINSNKWTAPIVRKISTGRR
jgi:hypothetical protein